MIIEKYAYWGALLIAVGANISANIALKYAMASVSSESDKRIIRQVLEQPPFWIGLFSAGVLLLSYLIAIRALPVSIAYITVTSMALVGLTVAEKGLFGVPIGMTKMVGVTLVISGMWLITRNA